MLRHQIIGPENPFTESLFFPNWNFFEKSFFCEGRNKKHIEPGSELAEKNRNKNKFSSGFQGKKSPNAEVNSGTLFLE